MAINIKNYTTEVAASKSIEGIERLLIDFGATNIMKEYGSGGRITTISFIIVIENMRLPFRLPAKVQEVFVWLKKEIPPAQRRDSPGTGGAGGLETAVGLGAYYPFRDPAGAAGDAGSSFPLFI